MAFHVPEKNYGLFDDVLERFRVLLKQRVITGIDETTLDRWLGNFSTDEERYFAACVLGRLIFRSQAMIDSSIDHLLHCTLPTFLRSNDLFPHEDIDSFLNALRTRDPKYPVRFVGVDGSKASDTGKSGVVIIRQYKRHAGIDKLLTYRPEKLSELSDKVRCIVFVDDMLGTGKQFSDFAKEHALAEKTNVRMVYCPLVAYADGLQTLRDECPWLTVLPVEVLDERHRFFCESTKQPGLWQVDECNTVADAEAFADKLATKYKLPRSEFSLDLVLGFEHSTPNNTLSLLWATPGEWAALLTR
ncbi:TPA: hypothetical protein ACKR1V_002465 [Pseudomonas aeruginosa]|uniref:phosphoribosyltransferase-like protein n=1 Tax=Pseudomonas aeruginosa TaxID=287 RepID=UPI00053E0EDE|nr:hypothetical protein [Pseudomonas aeruginosa]